MGMHGRPYVPVNGLRHGGGLTGIRGRRPYRPHRGTGYYGYPYFYPPFYDSDYYSRPAPQEAPPTRVIVVENTQPRVEAPPPPPPKSLVLERDGDHWVRITDSGQIELGPKAKKKGAGEAASLRPALPLESAPPRKLPPAVLVFRDGHQEEIARYTIIGRTIYASTNYWNNGSWTRKVPIAELNVPATLKLNQKRGSGFSLPSGPSVIVVRP